MSRWSIPSVLLLAALARGQDAAPVEEPVVQGSATSYAGSFAAGIAELRQLAETDDFEEALALSDSLLVPSGFAGWRASLERETRGYSERVLGPIEAPLEWFGFERLDGRERAEVHYARALVQLGVQDAPAAAESFELARALAGPGETRLDAVYNLGTLDLFAAEAAREQIPEISGAQPTPSTPSAAPGIPGVPGAAAPEEPDPLELARAGYLSAREHFVERLRADWSDPDARANSELVLRRLRELDEIERQREEQQQEQQDQQQQENEDGEEGEDSEEQQEQDEQQEDEQQQDSPEEEQPEEEEEDESEEQPEETDEESSEDEEQPTEQPEEQPLEEQHLTQEEMKRLLELLKEIDEDGEELRERLRGTRRVPVKKDW